MNNWCKTQTQQCDATSETEGFFCGKLFMVSNLLMQVIHFLGVVKI